jgi:hypothetical protein
MAHASPFATGCLLAGAGALSLVLALAPRGMVAQTRTLIACTPDALAVCTELQFGAVGGGLLRLGLRVIGATTEPLLPVATYNLVLATGAAPATTPADVFLPPVGVGGAVVSDPSNWEVFDTGDVVFLSALSNRGVGGCVRGADVGGFGQAVTTCGAGQLATFTFAATAAFDVTRFTILDLEAVGLGATVEGASCGASGRACVITADVTTPGTPSTLPEPATLALLGTGLLLSGVTARRRTQE